MDSPTEEDTAIQELDGAEWMGREIKVNKARPREEKKKTFSDGGRKRNSFSRDF
jgi:RNA recognition motif-containing protein